jgi:hypothetical protein
MSWRICSRNGESGAAESRRMESNGGKHVSILESRTKRVVTICRSLRKVSHRDTFISARTAKRNFRASVGFVARSRVWPAAENITAVISIRGFG